MSSSSRVKEGELVKYRNMMYGWKKYYFKLERSYLHYFEGQYVAEPKGTITRGEISQLRFSKDQQSYGFEIHLPNNHVWYLRAPSHEERMEWMRALQPDAYIVDPYQKPTIGEQPQPSAPEESQAVPTSNYPRLYPHLPVTSHIMQEETVLGPPNSPPPAYDEIGYVQHVDR